MESQTNKCKFCKYFFCIFSETRLYPLLQDFGSFVKIVTLSQKIQKKCFLFVQINSYQGETYR